MMPDYTYRPGDRVRYVGNPIDDVCVGEMGKFITDADGQAVVQFIANLSIVVNYSDIERVVNE